MENLHICIKAADLLQFIKNSLVEFLDIDTDYTYESVRLEKYLNFLKNSPYLTYANIGSYHQFSISGRMIFNKRVLCMQIEPSEQAYLPYTPFCDYLWMEVQIELEPSSYTIGSSSCRFVLFEMFERMNVVCVLELGLEPLMAWQEEFDPRVLQSSAPLAALLTVFRRWQYEDDTVDLNTAEQALLNRIDLEVQNSEPFTNIPLISEFYEHYEQIWYRFLRLNPSSNAEYHPKSIILGKKLSLALIPHFDILKYVHSKLIADSMFHVQNLQNGDHFNTALAKVDPYLVFDNYHNPYDK